jgi:arylsulfatase A-like enzyme
MMDRPNVLLIVFDTARADAFSPYAPGKDTPTFAQLAGGGQLHPNAIAPSNWTIPSHVAMLTGALSRSVGLSRIPGNEAKRCAPVLAMQRERYLPEVFRRAGYQTAGVSTNLWVSTRNGFAMGFDEYHDATGRRVKRMTAKGLRSRASWYLNALRSLADDGAARVEGILDTWVKQRTHAPFFWFVNLIECHSPYLPPKPYNDLGPLGRLAAARDARNYQSLGAVLRACSTEEPPPRRSLRRMRHLYDRSIRLMDDWLARVLQALDTNGLLDETLVIVTSDHGENFGEGSLLGHAGSLDDRLIKVPLLFSGPGAPPPPDGVTTLVDLPRLIAEATGLAHPWEPAGTDGIALAQYDGPVRLNEASGEQMRSWGATADGLWRFSERFNAATDGTLKLVSAGGVERLYDLAADPMERAPLAPDAHDRTDTVASLRRAIQNAVAQEWDPPADLPLPTEDTDTAELEERMRLLGYL